MPDTAPSTTTGNPFSLIAYVLFKARHALEDLDGDRPPRWVRICRGREFQGEALANLVSTAVGGLAGAVSFMAELTLDIEELLLQTDAAKAIAETSLELVAAATSPEFTAGIDTLLGGDLDESVASALSGINGAAANIQSYLDYIPEPHDVRQLGHEIYRLLCIVQQPMPLDPDGRIDLGADELDGEDHLLIDQCGKVRLCAWAYGRAVRTRGLGPDESINRDLTRLGSRRLFGPGASVGLAARARMSWIFEGQAIEVFDFDLSSAVDLAELVSLLGAHGYASPPMPSAPVAMTSEIVQNLLKFQHLNGLPLTGRLDDSTLNRLLNLDFERKNLRRAVRYEVTDWPWVTGTNTDPLPLSGELEVINGGADEPEREALALVVRTPHPYFVVPTTPSGSWPAGRGFISDGSATPGFVALASRARNTQENGGRYVGGLWSEGEAALGRFFWAARHTEPWKDGRSGVPGPDALYGGSSPAAGSISRMFQWIPLPAWLDPGVPPLMGMQLFVYATALQRSMWSDRDSSGYPDQGRILLEAYPASSYTSTTGARVAGVQSVATTLFPSQGTTAAVLQLPEVDRRRLWTLRRTDPLAIDPADGIVALCLVVEGHHRSAYDTDAYFDDLRVHYEWSMPAGGGA